MGHYVRCLICESEIYTTGTRVPIHDTPEGNPCTNKRRALNPVEYTEGNDSDPGVYQGGLPELGKGN